MTSTHSQRRSVHSTRRSFRLDLPRLVTTPPENDAASDDEAPTSPLLVVYSPPVSRRGSFAQPESSSKKSDEVDITDMGQGSGSLDPSSIPLRVVYSPAVSRSGSIGAASQGERPSIVLSRDNEPGSESLVHEPDAVSATTPSFEAQPFSENQAYRRSRHNSTASNMESRSPPNSRRPSLPSPMRNRRLTGLEEAREEDRTTPVFKAFPERNWFRSILVAKIALGIVTCCVLGNLIYT